MMAGCRLEPVDPVLPDTGPCPGRRSGSAQFRFSYAPHVPIIWERVTKQKGQESTVTIDPFHVRKFSQWSEAEFDLDDLVLPAEPQWHRCGAVHCIDRGPWLGTLVCCIRRSGHEDGHSMSLGDEGSPDYWREVWL